MTPTIVAISGFASNTGKTTLLCRLLQAFPGWEAIKMTRGHYRSCGKEPGACCVSHLLSDEPVIRSGRELTYTPGKDTGRYWDAGASNVHWVIVTEQQVERGIKVALDRVGAAGVFIEGTSFLKYLEVDLSLMAMRRGAKMKASASHVLAKTSALYLFDGEDAAGAEQPGQLISSRQSDAIVADQLSALPVYTSRDLPQIVARINAIHAAAAAA